VILENLLCDIRFAWRGLCRAKSFSAAAILTLGLGIAGTTVMSTLVRGVLLRPLPVRDQDRLIIAWKELRSSDQNHYPFGAAEIDAVEKSSQLIESAAGVDANGAGQEVITEDGVSSYVRSAVVTGGLFEVLGVDPILGRRLTRADDVEGAENVVAISHGLWTRRFGGSRSVIGRRITLGENRFTIIAVMPPDVDYPAGVEVWRTAHSFGTTGPFGDAARREIDLLARLRPAVTIEQAASELTALTRQLESAGGQNTIRGLIPVVRPFKDAVIGNIRPAIAALTAAVALVLLIACANVANLLLMRGESRRAELALREALGAARGRIVRQLLAESLVLTVAAAAVGFLMISWSLGGLLLLIPQGLPRIESVRIDAMVVVFIVVVTLVTSLLAGLAPALSLARADLVSAIRTGNRGVTRTTARSTRRALVVAQIALAVTTVAAAGLVIRSVLHLQAVNVGLGADRLVFVELSLPSAKYQDPARHAQFLERAMLRLEAVPAIAAATPVNVRPFSGEGGWDVPRFTADGQPADRAAANPSLNLESVYPNYFATFEIPIVRGRAFAEADRAGALDVAIVSEDVARSVWPGADPVGKRIKVGSVDSREKWLTVIGIAAPTRYRDLAHARPTLYLPAAQFLITAEILVLRTSAPLDLVASLTRDGIGAVDKDVLVVRVTPFTRTLDGPLARPRFNAFLLSIFGTVALLLSAIGLYAVTAADVRQRDRELALRIVLGASAANMCRLVLGEAVRLAGLGAGIGLVAAAGAARIVRGMLFQIDPLDPATLLGAALVLIAASALVSCVPTLRATRVDVVAVLRS